jgi:hypothetical protein
VGRKAWGVWWIWDAKLTIALLLEMTFISTSRACVWVWSTLAAAVASSVSRSCRLSTKR